MEKNHIMMDQDQAFRGGGGAPANLSGLLPQVPSLRRGLLRA